jgi:tetratricopeptide (TPR) repeat protein
LPLAAELNALGYNIAVLPLSVAFFVLLQPLASPDSTDAVDPAFVQIVSSQGEVIQRPPRPLGQHFLNLQLQITSRLDVPTYDFELEVVLLYEGREVPGWRLTRRYEQTSLPALGRARRNLMLKKIQYRVRLIRYRLKHPNFSLMVRVLESPQAADQAAALFSLSPHPSETVDQAHRDHIQKLAIAELRRHTHPPSARDALRLLLVLRASKDLALVELLKPILVWFSTQDKKAWGRAIIDLASRLVSDSTRHEARLDLLPAWARSSLAHDHRIPRALQDLVFSCFMTQGDPLVPDLFLLAYREPDSPVAPIALKLLESMGRDRPARQLALEKKVDQVRMIQLMGEVHHISAIDELVLRLESSDLSIVTASVIALRSIGVESVPALIHSLARDHPQAIRLAKNSLVDILKLQPSLRNQLAQDFQIPDLNHGDPSLFVERIAKRQQDRWRRAMAMEIDQAILEAESNSMTDGLRRLERLFEKSPQLYLHRAERIAKLYLSHAEKLSQVGNWDEAKAAAWSGLQLSDSAPARMLCARIGMSLAEGLVKIGQLDQAQSELGQIDPAAADLGRYTQLRLSIRMNRASLSLARGDYARARLQTDRAHSLEPHSDAVQALYTKLFVLENVVPLSILSVLLFALILALLLRLRLAYTRRRFVRIQSQIDQVSD